MKKWNTPEVAELNVEMTENGFFDTWFETWILFNDSENHCKKPVENTPDPDKKS